MLARESYDGDQVTITTDGNSDGVPDRPSSSLLRAKSTAEYDEQGRVFATHVFSVDPSSGSVSTYSLNTNTWFDHRGNVIKSAAPGGLVSKMVYDGAGRVTTSYTTDGGGDSGWSDASTVTSDAVLEQTEKTYDASGLVLMTTRRQRFHDETGTGALGTASTGVKARVSYSTSYYDKANRLTDSVNVGTNGASSCRTELTYGDRGRPKRTGTPARTITPIFGVDANSGSVSTYRTRTPGTATADRWSRRPPRAGWSPELGTAAIRAGRTP